MSNVHQGFRITQTDTVQQHPLGLEIDDPRGGTFSVGKRFRYVKAGSAISAGNVLVVSLADADEPNTLVPCSALNQLCVGVAEVAIASASFGWVQIKGRHSAAVKSTAVIAAGQALTTSSTAGAFLAVAGDGDSNVTSTKINALIAMAGSIGDSNTTTVEVMMN
jgi:hypothetical protein